MAKDGRETEGAMLIQTERGALWGSVFGGVFASLGLVSGALQIELIMREIGPSWPAAALIGIVLLIIGVILILKVRAYRGRQIQERFRLERLVNDQHAIMAMALSIPGAISLDDLSRRCALPTERLQQALAGLVEDGVCQIQGQSVQFSVVKLVGRPLH